MSLSPREQKLGYDEQRDRQRQRTHCAVRRDENRGQVVWSYCAETCETPLTVPAT